MVDLVLETFVRILAIPFTSSSLVFGFFLSLSSCHTFSMGFESEDSGGIFHQLMLSLYKKILCERGAVCLGSMSCVKREFQGRRDIYI